MDLRKRLERQIKSHESERKRKVKIGELDLVVYPNVFVPNGSSSLVFSNFFKDFNDKQNLVLDMGTGTGILALIISKYAKKVIASDINEMAVKSAQENVNLNKIGNIEVRQSDLFEKIPEKFD